MVAVILSLAVMVMVMFLYDYMCDLFKWEFRIVWSLAICYIVFACVNGHAGLINSFLSLPQWQPFARLSFATFLCHFLVIRVLEVNPPNGDFSKFGFVRKSY